MSGKVSAIDPELLELCGFENIENVIMTGDSSFHLNFFGAWVRLCVTSKDIGGEGSVLGMAREVLVWAKPDKKGALVFAYNLNIQLDGRNEVYVSVLKSNYSDGGAANATLTRAGEASPLDPPTPTEMLAYQAQSILGE